MHFGPYEVVREIGKGGMGTVYEGRHAEIPRPLALKVIAAGLCDEVHERRFLREGEVLAQILHPNVVRVHQLFPSGETLVLVTELVQGIELSARLADGPLPPEEARSVAAGIALALAELHARGLIHRDLKPDNVILRPDGTPVLIDFGLARSVGASSLTNTGELLGTPAFMAPEQARDSGSADERSDVYALGALLFACLAAEPPFRGATSLQTLDLVLHVPPQWPPAAKGWPPALRALCERALEKDPARRPPSAEAFREALLAAAPARGRAGLLLAGAGALALVLGGGAFALSPTRLGLRADPALAVRRGLAPLPTRVAEGSPELQAWASVLLVLEGREAPDAAELARGTSPGAQALAAALAARAGEPRRVEEHLQLVGEEARPELALLPFLADARGGGLTRGRARGLLRAHERLPEGLYVPRELRNVELLAQVESGARAPLDVLRGPRGADLLPWLRERLISRLLEGSLEGAPGTTRLELARELGPQLSAEGREKLAKRLGDVIEDLAPSETQREFPEEQSRALRAALGAYRALRPSPAPLPKREAIINFTLGRGFDLVRGQGSGRRAEDVDLAIAIADALPDSGVSQTSAGQSIWEAHLTSEPRWRALLRINERELDQLEAAERSGPKLDAQRGRILKRRYYLLVGLNELRPREERSRSDLERAIETVEALRGSADYQDAEAALDEAYVRWLLGRLPASDLARLPAEGRGVRFRRMELYAWPRERVLAEAQGSIRWLANAKHELVVGGLLDDFLRSVLWSSRTPDEAKRLAPLFFEGGRLLESLHHGYALHAYLLAARLAPSEERPKWLEHSAGFVQRAGWGELAEELRRVSPEDDEALARLAARAHALPRRLDPSGP